jgi:DNA-directed RNA polymerase specialized sigma24 family protein
MASDSTTQVRMPDSERDVFDLPYYNDLTQAEAARVLQIAEVTVRRHWLRARRRLGAFLLRDAEG